jgi:hypothetical protein
MCFNISSGSVSVRKGAALLTSSRFSPSVTVH